MASQFARMEHKLYRKRSSQVVELEDKSKSMNEETVKISKLIKKPPEERSRLEIEEILPYLAKRSELLYNLDRDDLYELIKYCKLQTFNLDDVIIKQGTIGDCFYIILTGVTSVYIDTSKSDDKDEAEEKDKSLPAMDELDLLLQSRAKSQVKSSDEANKELDRSTLGKFIMHIESGKSFGEVALLSENTERNATIVADMDNMDLLVVDKSLYDRTVKERQMADYNDRRTFIAEHQFFKGWAIKFKRLLEMSLVKSTYAFDNIIVTQGNPVDGFYFIIKGQAKLIVDPVQHKSQYPKLMKSDEEEKTHKHMAQQLIHLKRTQGYTAAEKRMNHRVVELAHLRAGDMFGSLESVVQLATYSGTLRCTSPVVVLHMNAKNVDRLITKKNPKSQELLKEMCFQSIQDMLKTRTGQQVPLLQRIYDAYIHEEPTEEVKKQLKPKDKNDTEFLQGQFMQMFIQGKMQLLDPHVPDSIFFRYKSEERRTRSLSAREKALRDKREKSLDGQLRNLNEMRKKAFHGRRARSRRELSNLTLDHFTASAPEQIPTNQNVVTSESTTQPPANHQPQILQQKHVRISTATGRLERIHEEMENSDSEITKGNEKLLADSQRIASPMEGDGEENSRSQTLNPLEHDNMITTIFKVMETINYRKATKKSKLRPQSAPNRLADFSMGALLHTPSATDILDPESFDQDTSERALNSLEERLKKFHQDLNKHQADNEESMKPVITKLRRFEIQKSEAPVAGGTVLVQLKPCKYRYATEAEMVDHSHVKRYILPKLEKFY